ncbi:MAG: ABC transporter permease [Candidatus Limnocylindrales bacterium]
MELVTSVVAWFTDPANWSGSNGVPTRIWEHVVLSGIAMAIALAIGLPAGLAIGHTGRWVRVSTAVAGLGRAVPSYALLILSVGYLGLGFASALPALVVLAVPPILVNTSTAIRDVDRDIVEAGRAMGMSGVTVLREVEIPPALPVMAAGVRVATLQVIATATLAALVAGGGLGRYIVDGFALQEYERMVAGALLVGGLALLTERAFTIIARRRGEPRNVAWTPAIGGAE